VIVGLWDELRRFDRNYLPLVDNRDSQERVRAIELTPGVKQNRNAFFKNMEVAVATHGGVVLAILATAVDIEAVPRQRKPGSCRPWLNEGGSPVLLRVVDLDMAREKYRFEFHEPHKRRRCPFDESQVPKTTSKSEDLMLELFMRNHPSMARQTSEA
jgi:hypothetical protein